MPPGLVSDEAQELRARGNCGPVWELPAWLLVRPEVVVFRSDVCVGAVWAPIDIFYILFFGGSTIPSEAPPRGPESTPGAQKRGPRAIPNDSRVGQNSTENIKNESKRQAR